MLMFLQFVTLDSIASVYLPLTKRRGYLVVFFVSLIMLVSVAVMNLVTAMLVDAAIAHGRSDAEFEKQKVRNLQPKIKAIFKSVLKQGETEIGRRQAVECFERLPAEIKEKVRVDGVREFYDMLDQDGSGTIDEEEFADGIFRIILSDLPYETLQELKLLKSIKKSQRRLASDIHSIQSTLEKITQKHHL